MTEAHTLAQEHIGAYLKVTDAVEVYNAPDGVREAEGAFVGMFIERAVATEVAYRHYYGKLTLRDSAGNVVNVVNVVFNEDTKVQLTEES